MFYSYTVLGIVINIGQTGSIILSVLCAGAFYRTTL